MSYLSNVLTDVLQQMGISQTELGKRADITQAQANRACRGSIGVGSETIRAIAVALPDEHRGEVVAAWLKDQLDPALLDCVLIMSARGKTRETTGPSLPDDLSSEQRELVQWVAEAMIHHTAVHDMIRGLRKISQPPRG